MSETNAKEDEREFNIDLENVNLDDAFGNKKIQIFMLTTTLPNPYTLVMFGVLKLFLEKIKEIKIENGTYSKDTISITFLLIHEIGKYEEMTYFFNPVHEHYKIFIPDEIEKDPIALKRHISSIIEMRLNEIKTLVNLIMLTIVDAKDERLITKDNLLNFNYEDIFHRSDEISNEYPDEVKSLMDSGIEMSKSPLLKKVFFEKVGGKKEELVKCLLKIFCDELSPTNEKNKDKAIYFVIDGWFKEMIENLFEKSSEPSKTIFEEIYERLLCPIKPPPPMSAKEEELDLHLNLVSKYMGVRSRLDLVYFSSLLQKLSSNLFTLHLEESAFAKYKIWRSKPQTFVEEINKYEKEYSVSLVKAITNGFLTVEKDTIRQLTYIQ